MKKIRKTFYCLIWIVYPLMLIDMFRLTILRERHNGVVYDEKIMNGVKIFGWCIRNAVSNPFVTGTGDFIRSYMLQYMFGGYKLTEYSIWSVILEYMLSWVFS